jgi:hypothetical protein
MNESHKNIIRDLLRVTPYITPFLRDLFKPLLKRGMRLSVVVICFEKKKSLNNVLFIN